MKEIFEHIDEWLQEAKDNQYRYAFTVPAAFYRGEVAAYTRVGLLLQRHLTSKCSGRDGDGVNLDTEVCPTCGSTRLFGGILASRR